MVAMDELLARNTALVAANAPPGEVGPRPRLRVVVVTCMDARIDIYRALGLRPGDAHVLRNAGGVVTDDVLRSLVLSQRLLGTLEVMVIQHTGCGLHGLRDGDLAAQLAVETGQRPPFAFGGFDDLDDSVRRSVDRIRTCPWLTTTQFVRGYVYDVATARLHGVVAESPRRPRR